MSKSKPALVNSAFKSIFDIDPNSFPPVPDFAEILISNLSSFLDTLLASSIIFLSLNSLCLIFSANTFFEEDVAKTAKP